MYHYSDMECLHRHNFFSFQAIFCSFAPLLTLKIKTWKKCKKAPGGIILLHMCTINQDHDVWFLRYEVQQTECFCHCGQFFALLTPPLSQAARKIKIWKKWKRLLEISSFYKIVPKNHDHMLYCSWDMVCDGCNCYFSFWAMLFPFTPPNNHKRWEIWNNEKKVLGYHFTEVYQKSWSYAILLLRYGTWQM